MCTAVQHQALLTCSIGNTTAVPMVYPTSMHAMRCNSESRWATVATAACTCSMRCSTSLRCLQTKPAHLRTQMPQSLCATCCASLLCVKCALPQGLARCRQACIWQTIWQTQPNLSPVSQLAVFVAVQILQCVQSFKGCHKIFQSFTPGFHSRQSACKMQMRGWSYSCVQAS